MQIGMIGLGNMGGNMSRRLMKAGHHSVVFARSVEVARGAGKGRRHSRRVAGRCGEDARAKAARGLADAAGRPDHRRNGRESRRPAGARRHHHRWRQFLLQGRHPPRQTAGRKGHSLRRLRHVRRRLGHRARLLHDDRRPEGGGGSPRSDLLGARARTRRYPAHAGARERRSARRARLHSRRAVRRRAFRQDGA